MKRKPSKVGGGAKTNLNGLSFEGRTDLLEAFQNHEDYSVLGNLVFRKDERVGLYFEKHNFYTTYLERRGIDWKSRVSKKYLPDSVFINTKTNVAYIIEKKFQEYSGSVDEKLQTCDFKRKIYVKLLSGITDEVNYYYLLNDWFSQPQYKDVFEYIESVGCKKFIDFIPFDEFGL